MRLQQQYQIDEPRYSHSDNLFLLRAGLKKITEHPKQFSKTKLIKQIQYLEFLVQDLTI